MSDLLKQPNIGKDTAARLIQVGICTIEKLRSVGVEQAFLRLQTLDSGACVQLLYGLEGAIEGVLSKQLSETKKLELLQFYRQTRKTLSKSC